MNDVNYYVMLMNHCVRTMQQSNLNVAKLLIDIVSFWHLQQRTKLHNIRRKITHTIKHTIYPPRSQKKRKKKRSVLLLKGGIFLVDNVLPVVLMFGSSTFSITDSLFVAGP